MKKVSRLICLILLLVYGLDLKAQVTFIVGSLPEATPQGDTIYITGTFNDWEANNPDYMLEKQQNGMLAITLSIDTDTIEYKFTRGSWIKVETNEHNTYMPNRIYTSHEGKTVFVKIHNWQDLGGAEPIHYIVFYYFAIAFQALVLSLFAFRIKKKDRWKFKAFLVHIIFVTAVFFGLVWYNLTDLIGQTHLILISQVLLFSWGPLAYTFYQFFREKKLPGKLYWHFIFMVPVFVFCTLRSFNVEFLAHLTNSSMLSYNTGNFGILVAGILFNSGYFVCLYLRLKGSDSTHNSPTDAFLAAYYKINILALLGLIASGVFLFSGRGSWFLNDFNLFFMILSLHVFLKAYFIWRYPEIIKRKYRLAPESFTNSLEEKISDFMQVEKPYKDPCLNITTLSEMLDTKPHILSKVLNDHFNKNFRDFVNEYRIREFIYLAQSGRLQRYTYLALAHEVGFNSKSTFNLAFKKFTNQNPRAYFKV